jgi:hypothetical protein
MKTGAGIKKGEIKKEKVKTGALKGFTFYF